MMEDVTKSLGDVTNFYDRCGRLFLGRRVLCPKCLVLAQCPASEQPASYCGQLFVAYQIRGKGDV
jgi:hypothetical protein